MRILLSVLMVMMLAFPAAGQLSPTNQQLLNDIFASELGYQEILERWTSLHNKPFRTPEEDYVMNDYAKCLAHDQAYISNQITKLKALGINFSASSVTNARVVALDKLRQMEQAEIDGWQAQIKQIQDDPNIPDEEKAYLIAELQTRILERENRKRILNNLTAGTITWNTN